VLLLVLFKLYDIENTNQITKATLTQILHATLTTACLTRDNREKEQADSSDQHSITSSSNHRSYSNDLAPQHTLPVALLEDVIDVTFQEADLNQDGVITKDEFEHLMDKYPDIMTSNEIGQAVLDRMIESLAINESEWLCC
jgi:Ca2+-binding EF-hand superfamily protein